MLIGRISSIAIVSSILAAALWPAAPAAADDLIVRYDQSQLLRLPRAVADIVVGNPSVADVSVQGGHMLVVTGKTFGVTNVIALDAERNVIQDQRIVVQQDERRVISLTKGSSRFSYSCTPNCSSTLTIGDNAEYFDLLTKHSSFKTKFSDQGGGGGDGGGGNQ